MNTYELVCVLSPELGDKEEKLIKKIESWIKKIGAKIKKKDFWGKKELAYQIKNFSEGGYFFWQLEADPLKIVELSPKIKLEDNIIRYLLVRAD